MVIKFIAPPLPFMWTFICFINVITMVTLTAVNTETKGKVHPRKGHEGPEWEQMYSSTLPSTSVLDVGGWSTPLPGRFTPGKDPVHII